MTLLRNIISLVATIVGASSVFARAARAASACSGNTADDRTVWCDYRYGSSPFKIGIYVEDTNRIPHLASTPTGTTKSLTLELLKKYALIPLYHVSANKVSTGSKSQTLP